MITYINTSSNHPPQIIKHLTQTISEKLFKNSSSAEVFEESELDYEEALKKCGCKARLQYIEPNLQQNNQKKNTENHLVQPNFQFQCKSKIEKNVFAINGHKIFNGNSVKVSYSCTQNISQIIQRQ